MFLGKALAGDPASQAKSGMRVYREAAPDWQSHGMIRNTARSTPHERSDMRGQTASQLPDVASLIRATSRYSFSRIEGVKVIPTNNPSGVKKRLTIWPHGSFLFLISMG